MAKRTRVTFRRLDIREMYIWQCEVCGRISRYMFFTHASNKNLNNCCNGKVRRIKFKNAW